MMHELLGKHAQSDHVALDAAVLLGKTHEAESCLKVGHVKLMGGRMILVHRGDIFFIDIAVAKFSDALAKEFLLVSEAKVHLALLSV